MDSNGPIKYSDLFQPDNSITDLQKQLKDLAEQYKTLMAGIRAEAESLKKSLEGVAGATASGQDTIKNATNLAEKLAKKEMELAQASSETAKRLIEVSGELRNKNNMTKLDIKQAKSEKDSYDWLSAQYARNKMELNKMSKATRENTEEGRALVKQTEDIMIKMKQLQEATGKHVLSVGDYGIATASMAADIRKGIQALSQMRIEQEQLRKAGDTTSERWKELSEKSKQLAKDVGALRKQYAITKLEVNTLGSQMGKLNDVMGVTGAISGGLSALSGTMALLGLNTDSLAQSLVKVNAVMAIANSVSQVYNGIFKSGNVLLFIRNQQLAFNNLALMKNTAATGAAKVAQIALNAVISANPYVLLAIAIGAVVAALALFISNSKKAAAQLKAQNAEMKAELDILEALADYNTARSKDEIKALEQKLALAKAQNQGAATEYRLQKQILDKKREILDENKRLYKSEGVLGQANIDRNRAELARLKKMLSSLEAAKAKLEEEYGSAVDKAKIPLEIDLNEGAKEVKIKDAFDIIQQRIDQYARKVEIGVTLRDDEEDIKVKEAEAANAARNAAQSAAAAERSALRAAEDARIALIKQRFDRERATEKAATARKIEDLQVQLKTEKNLTAKARKAINEQIISERELLLRKLKEIDNEEGQANLEAYRQLEDAKTIYLEDSFEKRRQDLKTEYTREVEDLRAKLANDTGLTLEEQSSLMNQIMERQARYAKESADLERDILIEGLNREKSVLDNRLELVSENSDEALQMRIEKIELERQIELEENAKLAVDLRQQEEDINRKYDQKSLVEIVKHQNNIRTLTTNADLDLAESEFNILERSEYQKTKFSLEQQKIRIRAEIANRKALLKIQTGAKKEATEKAIKSLENQLKRIDRLLEETKPTSLLDWLGFSPKEISALETAFDQIFDNLSSIVDSWKEAADAAVDSADKQVEAAQKILDAEIEARNNGYANSVIQAQKELDLAKKNREKALREQAKAQRAQQALDTATQASSLITATANLWAAFSGTGPWGVALALAAIAAMWASFGIAKIKAWQVAGAGSKTEKYGEGTVELLQGGSHASGNDIDLGTRKDGTRRRAEGGEFFAVINKRNSRRYRNVIPDVINSLNNGTFAQKYLDSYSKAEGLALSLGPGTSQTDLTQLESDVETIRKQGQTRLYVDAKGNTIIQYKNLTRKLKN